MLRHHNKTFNPQSDWHLGSYQSSTTHHVLLEREIKWVHTMYFIKIFLFYEYYYLLETFLNSFTWSSSLNNTIPLHNKYNYIFNAQSKTNWNNSETNDIFARWFDNSL